MNSGDLAKTSALWSAAKLPKTKAPFVAGELDDPPSVHPEGPAVGEGRQQWKEGSNFDLGQTIQLEVRTPFLEQVLRSPQAQGSHQETRQPTRNFRRSNCRPL
jgi:hypothetical protein